MRALYMACLIVSWVLSWLVPLRKCFAGIVYDESLDQDRFTWNDKKNLDRQVVTLL